MSGSAQCIITSLFKEKLFVHSGEAFGFHFVAPSAPQNIASKVTMLGVWCIGEEMKGR